MKTVVFVPTYRLGGLDVLEASLSRQTYKDFTVYVADQRFEDRWRIWSQIGTRLEIPVYAGPGPEIKPGYKRALAAAYNDVAAFCLRINADLLVSLQDYIWLPPDGVERFVKLAEKSPDDLLTGLTSISSDPKSTHFPDEYEFSTDVIERENDQFFAYSIFDQPYYDRPKTIQWTDARINGIYEFEPDSICFQILPEHWEANWAAVPVNYFRAGIFWDEEFDRGIAYENMDFAKRAIERSGRRVILDTRNHAISLPHKDYFSGEREEIVEFSNKKRYEDRWGPS